MFPYLLIFALACIIFFSETRKNYLLIGIFLTLFILIAGLRDMIGGFDVYVYAEVFEILKGKDLYLYTPFEKGYLTYYYFLQFISEKREFLFFATALIMTLLHFYSFRKLSPNIGISLFIYFCKFFLFSFVYLRQGLAMGIIWLAISYIINKRYWLIAIFTALAFTFHKSSLILLPFFFIAHRKFSNIPLLFITLLILFISLTPLNTLLLSFIADSVESQKLIMYAKISHSANIFYLIEGIIGIYLSIIFQKYFYKTPKTTVIGNGFFIYSIVILAGLTNATFIRFAWYFFIFVVLALPYIYYFYRYENLEIKPLFKKLIFIYFSLVFFRLLITYDNGDLMPYKSIYQDFDRNGLWEHKEYRQFYNIK